MTDRAAALRAAVRSVVAERGLHGASMSTIATVAGVAAGTTYVHYASKDDLVTAAYLEVKARLGAAVAEAVDESAPAAERFGQLWHAAYAFFRGDREAARFVVQFEAGPLAADGHERAMTVSEDPLVVQATRPDLAELLVDLPPLVLYDLAIGPAVRAAATGDDLDDDSLDVLVRACWRAVTV